MKLRLKDKQKISKEFQNRLISDLKNLEIKFSIINLQKPIIIKTLITQIPSRQIIIQTINKILRLILINLINNKGSKF